MDNQERDLVGTGAGAYVTKDYGNVLKLPQANYGITLRECLTNGH